MIMAGPDKEDLIDEYKETLAQIPCRHFNIGKSPCPFMNSCFYAHFLPDGSRYEYPWKENKINEDGEWEDDSDLTLAARIGELGI
mmetsp:Transcript_1852/g.1769  ORF Transcript_1852/g.1769 Transcript_1852/m.1769 type:complete len:85 (+) Transcript_1852:1589-1843(+)